MERNWRFYKWKASPDFLIFILSYSQDENVHSLFCGTVTIVTDTKSQKFETNKFVLVGFFIPIFFTKLSFCIFSKILKLDKRKSFKLKKSQGASFHVFNLESFSPGNDLSSKMSLWPKKSRSLGDLIDMMSPRQSLYNLKILFHPELFFLWGGSIFNHMAFYLKKKHFLGDVVLF